MINLSWRNAWVAVAAVALLQSAVLGWMVVDRVNLIKTGREIVLPIVPVDPRSLFRGDYVRLSYDVSRVPGELFKESASAGDKIYVTIEKTPEGSYKAVAASTRLPDTVGPDQIVLQGWLQYGNLNTGRAPEFVWVRYGIESYFVPEDTGLALEDLAREKKMAAVVAVDRDGRSAIKGLMIDGKLQYEEPLL
jgi:uncharacterized membrane-anchored protein